MSASIFHNKYPFINQPLPYSYESLEPFIDAQTMHLHHDKHLKTYVDNLNNLLSNRNELWLYNLEEIISNPNILPMDIKTAVLHNAGGVYNHIFYFQGMTDDKNEKPLEATSALINKSFGSFESFKKSMKDSALSVFGSGYAWLVYDLRTGYLDIKQTANQDVPFNDKSCIPLLNLDVWEHAYYLKNFNKRDSYIDNWFNVINWKSVEFKIRERLQPTYSYNQ
jgi:Fe-Mn family superoxide dismutase